MTTPLTVEVADGSVLIDAVRDLARDGQLPLYWRCGQGTCGACLVYLDNPDGPSGAEVAMTGKERNVLARKGVLSEAQRLAPTLPDSAELPRLACHVLLRGHCLKVRW